MSPTDRGSCRNMSPCIFGIVQRAAQDGSLCAVRHGMLLMFQSLHCRASLLDIKFRD